MSALHPILARPGRIVGYLAVTAAFGLLLALAIALDGMKGIYALAGDTDGIDGSEDNAGAIITPDTLKRAEAAGLNAKAMLADNDPWNFFNGIGDLLVTGPTLTNVNDFRAVLVEKR